MKSPSDFLRRHQVLVLAIAMPLLFGGVLLWMLHQSKEDPRIKSIRSGQCPVTLAELDAWYPAVPREENAALICLGAFNNPIFASENSGSDWLSDESLTLPLGEPLDAETKAELDARLKPETPVLAILHSIPANAPSRYPIDLRQGFVTLLPHLTKTKRAVILLGVESRWHSANGRTDQAIEALTAAGRVSDTLRQEPLFISYLVRTADWGITLNNLERLVSEQRLDDAQLAKLESLLAMAGDENGLRRALAGERTCGLNIFDDRTNTAAVLWGSPGSGSPRPSGEMFRMTMLISLFKATGLFAKDRAFYLDSLSNVVAAAELPFPERIQRMKRVTGRVPPNRFYIISSLMMPSLSSPYARDADHLARVRAARAALVIERYRNAHRGALPDDLAAAFGTQPLPGDPYSGESLLYRKMSPGYVVYSVGMNGLDDQGGGVGEYVRRKTSGPKQDRGSRNTSPSDVGFRVVR